MKNSSKKTSKRSLTIAVLGTLFALAIVISALYVLLPDYRTALEEQKALAGKVVLDRYDRTLRLFPDAKGNFSHWLPLEDIPDVVRNAVIAAEDKRFYSHPGFDPIAVVRALLTNISKGRTVSGASTITQQVVRLIKSRPRTYTAKLYELFAGIKMECQLSKDEILELYLNLSPTGGNIRGVGLGSRMYFSKDVSQLTVAEAALLAALPRSPSRFDPRRKRGREFALKEKDAILRRMASAGTLDTDRLALLIGKSVAFRFQSFPLEAPHFVDLVVRKAPRTQSVIRTTVDLGLQKSVERIVRSHRERLAKLGIEQAGVLVVSTQGPDILAMIGSLGYGSHALGYNNATTAKRGAGSTLKPFLYALGLQKGFTPASRIPDTFRAYSTPNGDYLPLNADRRSYGPVDLRTALGNSLNLSAVKLLKRIGVEDFYELLDRVGVVEDEKPAPEHYGLGLAIGNMEVSLYRLVQAFGSLAREGEYRPLSYLKDQRQQSNRVFSREVSYMVNHMLSDPSARLLTFGNPDSLDFGFPVAVKTGTSSNYRDCWIVGYTPQHIIGVWAGNFGGRPTNGVTGAQGAGPILKEIVRHLYGKSGPGPFPRPRGIQESSICWMSGGLAKAGCPYRYREVFIRDGGMPEKCPLVHRSDPHYYLGAPYAKWMHARQTRHQRGRFRLGTPETDPMIRHDSPPTSRVAGERIGPVKRTTRISIVRPHHLDRFVISPYQQSRIKFRAVPDRLVDHVSWFVDTFEIAKTPAPYEFIWVPTRGKHSIHAVTPDGVADGIVIHVE